MSESRGGTLIYKCRLCGTFSGLIHVPDLMLALDVLAKNQSLPDEWGPFGPSPLESHHCRDGRLGVCDLMGGKPDP